MSANLEEKIALAERAIGQTIRDKMLVLEALQTSGNHIRWNNRLISVRKNDNLAVLGDVVMKMILCEAWYETGRPKGQWTTAEQASISNSNLSRIGFDNGLDQAIILNAGTVRATEKLVSTTVEALVGAAFIEGRLDAARKAIIALGIDHEYLQANFHVDDSKSFRKGAARGFRAGGIWKGLTPPVLLPFSSRAEPPRRPFRRGSRSSRRAGSCSRPPSRAQPTLRRLDRRWKWLQRQASSHSSLSGC